MIEYVCDNLEYWISRIECLILLAIVKIVTFLFELGEFIFHKAKQFYKKHLKK